MQSIRERYLNDPQFHALVSLMVSHLQQCNYTPSEMRQAAILASIIYEEHQIRRFECPPIPKSVEHSLSILHEWTDNETLGKPKRTLQDNNADIFFGDTTHKLEYMEEDEKDK